MLYTCIFSYSICHFDKGELELQVKLKGSNAIGARFGSAIRNASDLNKDGYTGKKLKITKLKCLLRQTQGVRLWTGNTGRGRMFHKERCSL